MRVIVNKTPLLTYSAHFMPPISGQEMYTWCREKFGIPCQYRSEIDTEPGQWWNGIGIGEVIFKKEQDLTMFLMRWA